MKSIFIVCAIAVLVHVSHAESTTKAAVTEKESTTAAAPTVSPVCALPLDTASCGASTKSWGFDAAKKECVEFTWGGCKTNGNKFETKESCNSACSGETAEEELSFKQKVVKKLRDFWGMITGKE